MTILVFYHYSGYKCFEYYYRQVVQTELVSYFSRLISYERFVVTINRVLPGLFVYLQYCCRCQSQLTGTYFIDSKKLPVCDNRQIHSHRVFEGVATRGKSSTGCRAAGAVLWTQTASSHQPVGPTREFLVNTG